MKRKSLLLLLVVLWACSKSSSHEVAFETLLSSTQFTLDVSSTAIPAGGEITPRYGGYGEGKQPDLSWKGQPGNTKSIVVLAEDPDAPGGIFVHWLVTNIPPTDTTLKEDGTVGENSDGQKAYYPPKPPPGDPHHYHFEVFALETTLGPGVTTRDQAIDAMKGHVLAKGEIVATYKSP